jgi:flagellar biosynthesis protein FlhB
VSEEKPFEATHGRMERARREGDSARSSDLCALGAFALASAVAAASLPVLAVAAASAIRQAARGTIAGGAYSVLARSAFAVCCAAAAGAAAATWLQSGRVTLVLPKLNFGRLNPAAGLRRMFSAETLSATAKAAIAAAVAALTLAPSIGDALAAAQSGGRPESLVRSITAACERMLGALIATGFFFGVLDAVLMRRSWRNRIRMSFNEFREDQKQHDGDPQLRARRRASHRMLMRGSIDRLREAAFVVANPTHVAVALEYRPPQVEVPRVVIRAVDGGALEVRRRARELGIPIVEERMLARALFSQTRVDGYIPPDLYEPVARIVAALLAAGTL